MKHIILLFTSLLVISACVQNNPDPSWLEVTEWTLESNAINVDNEGELTHNFTDAWVFIDNKFIGVFEVPFKVPVLVSGNSQITLYPTIRNNGISATKKIYPFAEPFIIQGDLVQNETLTINPVTRYKDNTTITLWDFEDPANDGIDETPESNATLFVSTDPMILGPNNGNGVGQVNFDATNNRWQATNSQDLIGIPQQSAEVYLEVEYYNTLQIITGVLAIEPGTVTNNVNVQINAQDANDIEWKKIYLDLKTIVSGSVNAQAFRMTYDALLPDSLASAQINLDNIKLVY
jgi:hypothetical protein